MEGVFIKYIDVLDFNKFWWFCVNVKWFVCFNLCVRMNVLVIFLVYEINIYECVMYGFV